jgi:hypothetical protein
MREYFKAQLAYYPQITEEILDKVEFKTVWSGKRIQPGDKVVYAYVYLLNTDDLKAISFLERELDEINTKFKFIKLEDDIMPILAFKEDTKKRD